MAFRHRRLSEDPPVAFGEGLLPTMRTKSWRPAAAA